VFVILAVTAGSPAATSAGNEIRLPPPAIALTSPAASPVPAISVTDPTSKLCIEPSLLDACLPVAELFLDRSTSNNTDCDSYDRVDHAQKRLLPGLPATDVAVKADDYDQKDERNSRYTRSLRGSNPV
jgi:hypothetical protein